LHRHDLSDNERAKLKKEERALCAKRLAHFEKGLSHPAHSDAPPAKGDAHVSRAIASRSRLAGTLGSAKAAK